MFAVLATLYFASNDSEHSIFLQIFKLVSLFDCISKELIPRMIMMIRYYLKSIIDSKNTIRCGSIGANKYDLSI